MLKRPTREPWPPARREVKKCRPSLGKYEFCKALPFGSKIFSQRI
ncbi:MAG: hypothetical protein ACQEQO_04765 [Thermodesulfobacteriota bacterium]